LSSELQGIPNDMVSHDGIIIFPWDWSITVARCCNIWSCYKGWEIYLGHRLFMSTLDHTTGILVKEQSPFAAHSTYLHRYHCKKQLLFWQLHLSPELQLLTRIVSCGSQYNTHEVPEQLKLLQGLECIR